MVNEATQDRVTEEITRLEEAARERERVLKEGELLYESEMPGGVPLRRHKQSTMVKSGGVSLPERVLYYRSLNGMEAWLPTAQLPKMLAKRHEDGSPVFVKEKPEFPDRQDFEATCEVCVANKPGGNNRTQWPNEFAYYGHMSIYHPMEWEYIQKRSEKKGSLVQALLEMGPAEREALKALLGGTDANIPTTAPDGVDGGHQELQQDEQRGAGEGAGQEPEAPRQRASCPACGWQSKPVKSTGASLRTHQLLHCEAVSGVRGEAQAAH